MSHHIDLSSLLRKSVCELYSNLVTRPTGAAVRCEIEQELDRIGERALTVIDFTHVKLLDYSCADEIVAKLLLQYVSVDAPRREVYFVFRGINESHMDAIEAVLKRHDLALVSQLADGAARLIGDIGDDERLAWETMTKLGTAQIAEFATACGLAGGRTDARHALAPPARHPLRRRICRRRKPHVRHFAEHDAVMVEGYQPPLRLAGFIATKKGRPRSRADGQAASGGSENTVDERRRARLGVRPAPARSGDPRGG